MKNGIYRKTGEGKGGMGSNDDYLKLTEQVLGDNGRRRLVRIGDKRYWFSETESPSFIECGRVPHNFLEMYGQPANGHSGRSSTPPFYPTDYPFSAPAWVVCAHCESRYDSNRRGTCPNCGSPLIASPQEKPGECRVKWVGDGYTENELGSLLLGEDPVVKAYRTVQEKKIREDYRRTFQQGIALLILLMAILIFVIFPLFTR